MTDSNNTRDVYDFIRDYLEEHQGYAPSIRNIADGLYLGRSTVVRHLDKLEAWGVIQRAPNLPRSIRLTDRSWPSD